MDPHFLMGNRLSDAIPPWLGLAFGVGARDLDESGGAGVRPRSRLTTISPGSRRGAVFLHAVLTVVDFYHLPAPGIRLDGKRVVFGIFYP